jgi:hypothetical protein
VYDPPGSKYLHELIARLERQCLDEWRNFHYPTESIVDALAFGAQSVTCTLERKLGGIISVTVSLKARRVVESESWYFSLQRDTKRGYSVVSKGFTWE